MSQFDWGVIDPNSKSGPQLALDLNNFRDAIKTLHRGASRPPYAQPGMLWIKEVSTDRWELCMYDGQDDLSLRSINPVTSEVFKFTSDDIEGITAAPADSSLLLATTEFVTRAVGASASGTALAAATATDNATDFDSITDSGFFNALLGGSAGSRNANHPDGQAAAAANSGVSNYYWLCVLKFGSNVLQIAYPYASGSDTAVATIKFRLLGYSPWRAISHSGNLVNATTAIAGLLRLGTQAEVNAGVLSAVAVAPQTLESRLAWIKSTQQAITLGGLLTIPHGLGYRPEQFTCDLVNLTADLGWAAGEIVPIGFNFFSQSFPNGDGLIAYADTTNVYVRFGNSGVCVMNKTSGQVNRITTANWRLVAKWKRDR